ncbi:type III secretion protein U [Sphingomonas sp. UYAg733]
MAQKNDGGDKTERPTPKRLADARKKGDVAKSKDVTATVTLLVWLIVLIFGAGFAATQILALFDEGFAAVAKGGSFVSAAGALGASATFALMTITAIALIPAAIAGVLSEFLQAGGVFTTEKLKPELSKMNPVEGLKRMFSIDNLVDLAKTVAKAVLIVFVVWLVLRGSLAEILEKTGPTLLPIGASDGRSAAAAVLSFSGGLIRTTLLWTFAIFLLIAVADMAWQRHSYIKKLRMSMRDIREEAKNSEGDPLIKSNRRQLHEEWANQNAIGAARGASVLVVNPTHISIALDYDPESCPVPVMTARGEGPLAKAMRQAAEEAGVPIIRHVPVARKLYEDGGIDEVIPRDMFDAIAQIVLWAGKMRERGDRAVNDLESDVELESA